MPNALCRLSITGDLAPIARPLLSSEWACLGEGNPRPFAASLLTQPMLRSHCLNSVLTHSLNSVLNHSLNSVLTHYQPACATSGARPLCSLPRAVGKPPLIPALRPRHRCLQTRPTPTAARLPAAPTPPWSRGRAVARCLWSRRHASASEKLGAPWGTAPAARRR